MRIDEALNPVSEQALGRLTSRSACGPSYPAEFIIVRIGIWAGGTEVTEGLTTRGARPMGTDRTARRSVRQLQLPGRDRRHHARRVPRGQRLRLDHRRHRAPRGRRQHHAAQAPGHDQVQQHHAEVGHDRRRRALQVASRRRERETCSARTARSCCSTGRAGGGALELRAAPGRRSGTAPTSTPRATTSRSRPWSWRTKASSGPDARSRPCSRPSTSSRSLGYLDDEGTLHRDGIMRLATAADEILPLKDPRVQKNPAYLIVILLSRVVTRLGRRGSGDAAT